MDHSLAIVIPAFKSAFFRRALESIANQTDRRFQLYIGDDASPEPLAEITREFSKTLPINYLRFEENLGGVSLIKHWERCLRMSREPWVWLFSDDDVMDATCVEKFFEELKTTEDRHEIYRFNTIYMDGEGRQLSENPPHPQNENGPDFLLARLRGGRNSTLQELIFSREAWERAGGFPEFPLGWASDDAFIATVGTRKSIRTICGPRVRWRLSGKNISSKKCRDLAAKKLDASKKFLEWAIRFLDEHPPGAGKLTRVQSDKIAEDWFFLQLIFARQSLRLRTCLEIDALAAKLWNRWKGYGFLKSLKFNLNLMRSNVFGQ